jgi:hypothetical protein
VRGWTDSFRGHFRRRSRRARDLLIICRHRGPVRRSRTWPCNIDRRSRFRLTGRPHRLRRRHALLPNRRRRLTHRLGDVADRAWRMLDTRDPRTRTGEARELVGLLRRRFLRRDVDKGDWIRNRVACSVLLDEDPDVCLGVDLLQRRARPFGRLRAHDASQPSRFGTASAIEHTSSSFMARVESPLA